MLQAGRQSEALLGQSSVWLEGRLASPCFPLDSSLLQRPVEWREKFLWAWGSAGPGFCTWCACVLRHFSRVRLCVTLWTVWDSPGKNTGVGGHALLQGRFLTQGSIPCLLCFLHWQAGS